MAEGGGAALEDKRGCNGYKRYEEKKGASYITSREKAAM